MIFVCLGLTYVQTGNLRWTYGIIGQFMKFFSAVV